MHEDLVDQIKQLDQICQNPLEEMYGDAYTGATPREREIMHMVVCDGMTSKETAWELQLSHQTVKIHLSSLYARLGFNRAELRHNIFRFIGIEVRELVRLMKDELVDVLPDLQLMKLTGAMIC